jgi:hypothetical protein
MFNQVITYTGMALMASQYVLLGVLFFMLFFSGQPTLTLDQDL